VERFSKVAVTLWTCAAVLLQAWLLRSWSALPWLTPLVGVTAMVLAWVDRRTIAAAFAVAYVFPVLVWSTHGVHYPGFAVVWMAAILGAILPDALRRPWHLPPVWRAALAFAALVVAVSATLSIWRETQGVPVATLELGPPIWEGPVQPSFPVRWILNVSIILLVGLLWFDWLLGARDFDLDAAVITPLLASSIVMSSVSAYQLFVDMRFANPGVYGSLQRASGTMFDGNVAGMIAALWVGGALLWAQQGAAWRKGVAVLAVLVNSTAVWASGSRTALVAALTIVAFSGLSVTLAGGRVQWRRLAAGVALLAVLMVAIMAVGMSNQLGSNPGARIWDAFVTHRDPADLANFLWTRNGYGTAATLMLRHSPIVGVGVGSYHAFVGDLAGQVGGSLLSPDNAQNWLRHQVAEFGLLGGLGWVVWYLAFAWFVLIPRRGEPAAAWIVRGILVGFGVISWLGMPGQDAMVAMTFWTFAFWYTRLVGLPSSPRPLPAWTWRAVAIGVIVFAGFTLRVSATTWGVAARSLEYDRPFTFGMQRPAVDGPDAGYRRALSHATALVTPYSRWLVIRVKRAPDAADRPVDVLVASAGRTVLKARLDSDAVVEGFVPVKPGDRHMLFEMTARPPGALARLLPYAVDSGVLVSWGFVEHVSGETRQYSARWGGESR
jgi:hypothetical protein